MKKATANSELHSEFIIFMVVVKWRGDVIVVSQVDHIDVTQYNLILDDLDFKLYFICFCLRQLNLHVRLW